MNDNSLAMTICLWGLNYLFLSSITISVVWCGCKILRLKSHTLQDILWKFAIVGPVICTTLLAGWSPSLISWNLATHFETEEQAPSKDALPVESLSIESEQSPSIDTESQRPLTAAPNQVIARAIDSIAVSEYSGEVFRPKEPFPVVEDAAERVPEGPSSSTDALPVRSTEDSATTLHSIAQMADNPVEIYESAEVETLLIGKVGHGAVVGSGNSTLRMDLWSSLAGAICLIAAIGLLRRFVGLLSLHRRVQRCRIISSGVVRESLNLLLKKTHCKFEIQLLEGPKQIEPAAFGAWKRRIIVPSELETRLSADETEALLAHELAHLIRQDPLWMSTLKLVCSCFCWQPLNFVALKSWRRSAEYACDSQAIASGINHLQLARCLTQAASWKISDRAVLDIGASMGVGGAGSSLSERIERLVAEHNLHDPWMVGWRKRVRYCIVFLAFSVTIFNMPRLSWTAETSEESLQTQKLLVAPEEPEAGSESLTKVVPVIPRLTQDVVPVPVESQLPVGLRQEIDELALELNYALKLLARQEDDPQVIAAIDGIQVRLQDLKAKAEAIDQSFATNGSQSSASGFSPTDSKKSQTNTPANYSLGEVE